MAGSSGRVGVGFLAVTHPHVYTRADLLADFEGVDLVAVFDDEDDANAETFAERYSVERESTAASLLARDDIDAVIVESWTENMAGLAIAALEAGKAVLLEKPGGNNTAAIQSVVDAVERTGGHLTVGYMVRQSRSHERLKAILESGVLGRVTVARFHVSVPAPDAVSPWFNLETDVGGVLFEDGCHMVDLVVDLFGKPSHVKAITPKYGDLTDAHGHLWEDSAVCLLEWDTMAGTMSVVGWEAQEWLESWEIAIFGDKGSVFAGPLPDRVHLFVREETESYSAGWTRWDDTQFNVAWLDHEAKHVWHAVQHREFYRSELNRFISDVREGGDPLIPASHALMVTETITGLYESARGSVGVEL